LIRVCRGVEPKSLRRVRAQKLKALRALGRTPSGDEIDGYRVVAGDLWKAQLYKCCYCERKILRSYNDVEHYRPKGSADRRPGCTLTHGYWWLAYSWDNLLFACPHCNRTAKNDRFPLMPGDAPLHEEDLPPGSERPLLLDPGAPTNPVEHIKFVLHSISPRAPSYWWAQPRDGSPLGAMTIDVCQLNSLELRELRNDHVKTVLCPQVRALLDALDAADNGGIQREFSRSLQMLNRGCAYVALAYDVLCHYIPNTRLHVPWGKKWPRPCEVPSSR
jgi:hypothetical protein